MKILFLYILQSAALSLFLSSYAYAQFPPGAGHAGTTAMYVDSSAFINWAKSCHVSRGYVNIADTSVVYNGTNRASYGEETDALGIADNSTISLGDGGSAVLTFKNGIVNYPGFDFAVFENSLNGSFLELGFVEVSSDDIHYFRFPSVSLTQTTQQVGTFGTIDPEKINNLAGKYEVLYGTPFDLDTLAGIEGLDVNRITSIKITDVVGNIQTPYASHDSQGNLINDPWPTPFNTCGFDLDAVGVIHEHPMSVRDQPGSNRVVLSPNPVRNALTINIPEGSPVFFVLSNLAGIEITRIDHITNNTTIRLSDLPAGIYLGRFRFSDGSLESQKIIKL